MEAIEVYFTNAGVPATGLTPTVNIWFVDGTQKIVNGPLVEIASGRYTYNFEEYDASHRYLYLFDGGPGLSDGDRYKPGGNIMDAYSNKISWGRTATASVGLDPNVGMGMNKISEDVRKINLKPIVDKLDELIQKVNETPTKIQETRDNLVSSIEQMKTSVTDIQSGIRDHTTSQIEGIKTLLENKPLRKSRVVRKKRTIKKKPRMVKPKKDKLLEKLLNFDAEQTVQDIQNFKILHSTLY